jgi:hypothetical protein
MKGNRTFEYKNSREFLRVLINRAYLSFGIPLLLFGWLYLESTAHNLKPLVPADWINTVSWMILVVMVFFVAMGYQKSLSMIKRARTEPTLIEKLSAYRNALTLRFIYFSVAAFFVGLGLYLTANELISVLFAGVIVVFSINNPTLQGIAKDLRLKGEEKDTILKVKEFE